MEMGLPLEVGTLELSKAMRANNVGVYQQVQLLSSRLPLQSHVAFLSTSNAPLKYRRRATSKATWSRVSSAWIYSERWY